MNRFLKLVFFLAFTCCYAVAAFAQSAPGFPPFGSFGGGNFDKIDLGNLNIHFSIPVVTKAGRGLPVNLHIDFDNATALTIQNAQFHPQDGFQGGAGGFSNLLTGYLHSTQVTKVCNYRYGWEYVETTYDYYQDLSGTIHRFSGVIIDDPNYADPNCHITGPTSASGTATDGSGYVLNITNTADAQIVAPSGVQNKWGAWSGEPPRAVMDTNGNEITSDGVTITDTLGTAVATIAGSNTSPPVTLTYTAPSGPVSVKLNYTSYVLRTNFQCTATPGAIGDYNTLSSFGPQPLVTSITLPDGSSYSIGYEDTPGYPRDKTGRISSITLPSGGTITYSYSGGNNGINCSDGTPAIVTRTTPDGTWIYNHVAPPNGVYTGTYGPGTTTVTDPQGNQTVLTFQQGGELGTVYETTRKIYQGATLKQTILTCYNGSAFPCDNTNVALPILRRTVMGQWPDSTGTVSEADTTYNASGLPTEVDEYDYGLAAPGAILRKTITTYNATLGNNILDRPQTVTIEDGNNNVKAQTTYAYDESAVTATSSPNHVAISGSRGNPTTITYLVGGGASPITRKSTYFDTGLVQTTYDAKSNSTSYTYGADCGNAYPSSVTLANGLNRSMIWNCDGGVVTSITDENQNTTTYSYGDPNYWRKTSTSYPGGGYTSTAYNFSSIPWTVVTSTALSATQNETSTTVYDSQGRVNQQQLNSDPQGVTYVDTTYDSLGRVSCISSPYRSTSDPTYGLTCNNYDVLGRLTSKVQPDGNQLTASYSANCVTATDESGKSKKECSDGLGRVSAVYEPDSTGALNWETDYQHDTLNDLTSVTQKGGTTNRAQWRQRTFSYDSIGRLTQATTPESGTTTYSYSSGGSLCSGDPREVCSQTDARGLTTAFTYDVLNRLLQKSYSDGSPTVGYQYDQPSIWGLALSNSKGRLTHEYNNNRAERVFSYDAMGRLVNQWDCLPSNCGSSTYNSAFAYDLAGNLTQITYPSGRVVSYTVGGAGRPTQVTFASVGSQNVNYPYASGITYAPSGNFALLPLGNGLTGTYSYNNRNQLTQSQWSSPILTAANHSLAYVDASGHNNGNVQVITDLLNSARTQTFTYDQVNRLATATETSWGLAFGYDAWGNLLQQSLTKGSAPTLSLAVLNNNQLSGYSYL